ncbi:MAG: DUF1178 family protein [Alphaproteobacteria bacterium]|nr:MAG: DUF1178 family protein [Alphaproteobacteria bacterium]
MIVYDLKCRKGHVFEAWFRDSAAYDEQAAAGKVVCPMCGSKKVEKAPMAPRVARSRGDEAQASPETRAMQEAIQALRRKIEQDFDYVGPRFAEEARRIHYGETDAHNIYGEATDEEAAALSEEGIEFARIPWPVRHDS